MRKNISNPIQGIGIYFFIEKTDTNTPEEHNENVDNDIVANIVSSMLRFEFEL